MAKQQKQPPTNAANPLDMAAGPPTVEDVLAQNVPDPLEEAKREAQAIGGGDDAPPPPPAATPPAPELGEDSGEPPPVAEPPKPQPRWRVVKEGRVNFGNGSAILRAGKVLSHEWADRLDVIREHGVELEELPPE